MAKLWLGNWSVSNIDELRENYSCYLIFNCRFMDGILLQWLKDSGYSDEAKAVESLYKQDDNPLTNWKTKRIKLYQILNNTDKVPFFTTGGQLIKNLDECRLWVIRSEILWYFRSGNLAIWLRQNGYEAEAKAVESIPLNEYALKFDEEVELKTYRQIHKILHNLDDLAFIFNNNDIIKNIEELREDYRFSKIFIYFKNGVLVQWLEKNGHSDEAKAIASLPSDLDERKIHLNLYKILNFKDSTPQWFDEWSKAFEKYFELCGEIDELLDDAISKYCNLGDDYKENEDEKYERENVYNDIEQKENEIDKLTNEMGEICGDTERIEYKLDLSNFKLSAWWQYKYDPL